MKFTENLYEDQDELFAENTVRADPALGLVDWTERAANNQLGVCYGRDQEITEVIATLLRFQKNFPVLVGEPGVGKTSIVEGVAAKLLYADLPFALKGARLYELSYARFAQTPPAETAMLADRILTFLRQNPKAILFLDEMHAFFREHPVLSNALKPAIARGEVKIIGATTPDEFSFIQRSDPALARRMAPIYIREMSAEQTLNLLRLLRPKLESHHGVFIEEQALSTAVDLAKQLSNLRFPDKAIDLVDAAAAKASLLRANADRSYSDFTPRVTPTIIREAYKARFGERALSGEDTIAEMEETLRKRVFGQEEGVEQIIQLLSERLRFRMSANRPLASFIFAGPSGVGKQWVAQLVAESLFGNDNRLLHVPIGHHGFSPTYLLGSPPGYIGSDREPPLVAAMKTSPNRVLLFTFYPSMTIGDTTLLHSILSNGTITDYHGQVIDFRSAVIIIILEDEELGKATDEKAGLDLITTRYGQTLGNIIHQVDRVIFFKPLDYKATLKLAETQVEQARSLLQKAHNRPIHIDPALTHYIAEQASATGKATDVVRLVERAITAPVVDYLRTEPEQHTRGGLVVSKAPDMDAVVVRPLQVVTSSASLSSPWDRERERMQATRGMF